MQPSLQNCQECDKKTVLIQKYVSLIDLLKKKSEKSFMSTTLKKSMDVGSTSNTQILLNQKNCKGKIFVLLNQMIFRRKIDGFVRLAEHCHRTKVSSAYKFLIILEKQINQSKRFAFNCFKKFNTISLEESRSDNVLKILEQKGKQKQKLANLLSQKSSFDKSSINPQFVSQILSRDKKSYDLKQMNKKLFILQHQNAKLRYQNNRLSKQLQESIRRLQIQSKKKRQSLQMLAQQMAQKNQIISDLQTSIKIFQQRSNYAVNNILQSQAALIKKQLERYEKINDKLNYEAQVRTQQYKNLQSKMKQTQSINQKLQKQNTSLKETVFQYQNDKDCLSKIKKQQQRLTNFLERKINDLKTNQKQLNKKRKECEAALTQQKTSKRKYSSHQRNVQAILQEGIYEQDPIMRQPMSNELIYSKHFQMQYKIQKILTYLFNIELQDNWITNDQNIFDQEEMKVLNDIKLKFVQLNEQIKSNAPIFKQEKAKVNRKNSDGDEIYFNEHHVTGSIFDVFDNSDNHEESPLQTKSSKPKGNQCTHCGKASDHVIQKDEHYDHGQPSPHKGQPNFTIKLLEMEIQKNKQIQKISELKERRFLIRNLILNLLKSFELKNLKQETHDIMELVFEEFEYSQEEREAIFNLKKKKGFFGFI